MSDVLVLAYHAVSDNWDWRFTVTPAELAQQLRHLLGRGYRPVTFADAVGESAGKRVAVTFDDAFLSVYERAFPVLQRLGVPATIFAVSDYAGSERLLAFGAMKEYLGGPHEREMRPMTWEQLVEVRDAGWEIGSHTRTHPDLTTLADGQLDDELGGSKRELEQRLGGECRTFAYPFGATDDRVRSAVERAGYVAAADFPPRFVRAGRFSWPRVGVYREDDESRFARKVSPLARRVRASSLAQRGLELARSVR